MFSFLIRAKPKSHNSWKGYPSKKKQDYQDALKNALLTYHPPYPLMDGDLYGVVYHFYNENKELDADNLSKPIWDCMRGILYADDNQVKLRIAGSFDLLDGQYDFTTLDFSRLPEHISAELLEGFETENHIIYVECGLFRSDMIRF